MASFKHKETVEDYISKLLFADSESQSESKDRK
jgi:hypothetical protein